MLHQAHFDVKGGQRTFAAGCTNVGRADRAAFGLATYILNASCVVVRAFETGGEALREIGKWLTYYNTERPHSRHGILTPNEAYERKTEPGRLAA